MKIILMSKNRKNKKKIILISIVILIIGLLIGGFLIYTGASKQLKVNQKYSDASKEEILKKIDREKEKLETKKKIICEYCKCKIIK